MLLRLLLRIVSLGAKFALTVVIARTLGFAAVADYGLAVAVSVVASKVLGLGFSAELNRRLAGAHPAAAIGDARALRRVYGAAYLLIALAGLAAWCSGWLDALHTALPAVLPEVVLVAFAEHYALETNSYVFALHRPRAASLMLFVRTGAWAALAISGLFGGVIGDLQTVLWLWIGANLVVIAWAWRVIEQVAHDGPAAAGQQPGAAEPAVGTQVDVQQGAARTASGARMRGVFTAGAAFYVATILMSGLQYLERFIAVPYLDSDMLGRYVFIWASANAVQTIAYASLVVTAGPRLAKAAVTTPAQFTATLRHALRSALLLTLGLSLAMLALSVPLFRLSHQPVDRLGLTVLVVLLASFVLRSLADLLWVAAIALRQGKPVALGMAVLTGVGALASWWLVAHGAMLGVAFAHLGSSVLVAGWLAWVVHRNAPACEPCDTIRPRGERRAA
jgi:O-antigen/teichoic acid export membrane protein